MIVETKYICEICGSKYDREDSAKYCEASLMEGPARNVGDKIKVKVDGGNIEEDEVVKVEIIPSYVTWNLDSWEGDFRGMENRFMALPNPLPIATHEYAYRTKEWHFYWDGEDDGTLCEECRIVK